MSHDKPKVVSGELVPKDETLPVASHREMTTRISTDGPVRLWWSNLLAQKEEKRWTALEAAARARTGAEEALVEYGRVRGQLADIDEILEADRIGRRADRTAQERRLEEERVALDRVKQDRALLGEETEIRRMRMAAEKRALQKEMAGLDRDIAKIKESQPEKKLHPDAKRFEDAVEREEQILASLKQKVLAIVQERGGKDNLSDADRKRIEDIEDMAQSILRS